jgi:hypothetical protein
LLIKPLKDFLAALPLREQESVVPNASACVCDKRTRKKPRSNASHGKTLGDEPAELSTFELEAQKFLTARFTARGETPSAAKRLRMWRMVNALNNCNIPSVSEKGFWESFATESDARTLNKAAYHGLMQVPALEDNCSRNIAPNASPAFLSSPFPKLLKLHKRVQLSTQLHHLASRIIAILIHYHHKQISNYIKGRKEKGKELLRLTGVTLDEFEKLKAKAQGWLRVINALGVGVLAVADANADDE